MIRKLYRSVWIVGVFVLTVAVTLILDRRVQNITFESIPLTTGELMALAVGVPASLVALLDLWDRLARKRRERVERKRAETEDTLR